ncbi:MAG TPA: DUF3365 domain-containing protein [Gammaproteobacteria bacterium]|nr:DUF3365 domain-containing protein [Gammaproteobacteria bacterium]
MDMRRNTRNAAVAAAALLLTTAAAAGAPDRLAEGREIAQQFGAELRAELQAAMAEGGPLAAVRVCNEEAPRIARQAERRSGAEVGRTSTRLRNPDNRPDAHERGVLAEFEEAVASGDLGNPPERLETLPDGRVRYMRGIIVGPPCLVCHGQALAPPVAEAIDARYPEDEARGYAPGDLRGAFTITWPAD